MNKKVEAPPPFEEALLQLRQLLPDDLRAKDFVWAFREDLAMGASGAVVSIDSLVGNGALVRDFYEAAAEDDGGIALVCFGIVDDAPCCYVESSRNGDQAERLMLPAQGLKLSVAQPLREIEPVATAEELASSNQDWGQLGWEAVVSRDDVRSETKRVSSAGVVALEAFQKLPRVGQALLESEAFRELLSALEYLLPDVLDSEFESWHGEGLDGVLATRASFDDNASLEIRGACILINDQTTTPVVLSVRLAKDGHSLTVSGRLGEADDAGKMLRTPYGSSAMSKMMARVGEDPDAISWVYDFTQGAP